MGGGEVVWYISMYGIDCIEKVVFVGVVFLYLYKLENYFEGVLDDVIIEVFKSGVINDCFVFFDEFIKGFFVVGNWIDLVSELFCLYNWDIVVSVLFKGIFDCIIVFSKIDFRKDLEKFNIFIFIIYGDFDVIVLYEYSGKLIYEVIFNFKVVLIKGGLYGLYVMYVKEFNEVFLLFLNDWL